MLQYSQLSAHTLRVKSLPAEYKVYLFYARRFQTSRSLSAVSDWTSVTFSFGRGVSGRMFVITVLRALGAVEGVSVKDLAATACYQVVTTTPAASMKSNNHDSIINMQFLYFVSTNDE